jgi:CRP/FNR family nitrogen fixation transcriptional regulator
MTVVSQFSQPVTKVSPEIAALGFFVPQNARDSAEPTGARSRYSRNEEIFGEGDPAEFVYRVASGTVRLYRLLSDGRRQISGFCFVGDTFGLTAGEDHWQSAEAVTDCEIVATPRQAIFRQAEQNASFAYGLWTQTAAELAVANEHLMMLGRQTAVERVASFLLGMAKRQGDDEFVTLPMSRQDIADYLGLTIETVSRTLTHLQERGVLEVATSRKIALRQPATLRRLNA